jgi:hypothetical protein
VKELIDPNDAVLALRKSSDRPIDLLISMSMGRKLVYISSFRPVGGGLECCGERHVGSVAGEGARLVRNL